MALSGESGNTGMTWLFQVKLEYRNDMALVKLEIQV